MDQQLIQADLTCTRDGCYENAVYCIDGHVLCIDHAVQFDEVLADRSGSNDGTDGSVDVIELVSRSGDVASVEIDGEIEFVVNGNVVNRGDVSHVGNPHDIARAAWLRGAMYARHTTEFNQLETSAQESEFERWWNMRFGVE